MLDRNGDRQGNLFLHLSLTPTLVIHFRHYHGLVWPVEQ